ncbi:MAG TPA: DUF6174 domain-containing protein [Coleofasciculaceae cyanobacterium]|jgi:hypothetical protein
MAFFNQSRRKWLLTVTSAALGGLTLFGICAFSLNSSETNQLAAAKKTWNSRSVSHYRLSLKSSSPVDCQQEVEIQNEKVTVVRKNTCSTLPAMTVKDLFNKVASLADGKQCGPNGCACDGRLDVDAIYDPQFGYPRQLEIRLKPKNSWLDFDSWNGIFTGKACTAIGFVEQKITVIGFSPIE